MFTTSGARPDVVWLDSTEALGESAFRGNLNSNCGPTFRGRKNQAFLASAGRPPTVPYPSSMPDLLALRDKVQQKSLLVEKHCFAFKKEDAGTKKVKSEKRCPKGFQKCCYAFATECTH